MLGRAFGKVNTVRRPSGTFPLLPSHLNVFWPSHVTKYCKILLSLFTAKKKNQTFTWGHICFFYRLKLKRYCGSFRKLMDVKWSRYSSISLLQRLKLNISPNSTRIKCHFIDISPFLGLTPNRWNGVHGDVVVRGKTWNSVVCHNPWKWPQ